MTSHCCMAKSVSRCSRHFLSIPHMPSLWFLGCSKYRISLLAKNVHKILFFTWIILAENQLMFNITNSDQNGESSKIVMKTENKTDGATNQKGMFHDNCIVFWLEWLQFCFVTMVMPHCLSPSWGFTASFVPISRFVFSYRESWTVCIVIQLSSCHDMWFSVSHSISSGYVCVTLDVAVILVKTSRRCWTAASWNSWSSGSAESC